MVKYIIFGLLLLLALENAEAYNRQFQVQGHFNTMKVDEQGKIFLLTDNAVHMYNERGHNIAVQRFSGGMPLSLELSKENEVYLFFKGSNEVRITDQNLATRRKVSFENSGITNPGPACYAGLGRMWVYDTDREKFLLLDHNMEERRESEPLSNFAFHTLNPISVTYYNNHLFVNNDGHEVLVFNRFGNYMNRLDVRTEGHLQVSNGKIYFVRHGNPAVMDINSGRVEQPPLPFRFSTVREYLMKNNKLYILSAGGLSVYEK